MGVFSFRRLARFGCFDAICDLFCFLGPRVPILTRRDFHGAT